MFLPTIQQTQYLVGGFEEIITVAHTGARHQLYKAIVHLPVAHAVGTIRRIHLLLTIVRKGTVNGLVKQLLELVISVTG